MPAPSTESRTSGPDWLRRRVRELAPWYQNIDLGQGVSTKAVDAEAIFAGQDIPAPLWAQIAPRLGRLDGKHVLDIGCNAGYMSFESKRLGAASVLGVDVDLGATTSFIDQAEFCRDVLGLDVDFQLRSFMDLAPDRPFDVVLFCGVLYHLENWADALDQIGRLTAADHGTIVLETAISDVTLTTYGDAAYRGDRTTFFVPSLALLSVALEERGFRVHQLIDLGERALALLSVPRAAQRHD